MGEGLADGESVGTGEAEGDPLGESVTRGEVEPDPEGEGVSEGTRTGMGSQGSTMDLYHGRGSVPPCYRATFAVESGTKP